ncbi:MAG TPA: single-stranded DNA-binding protein [Marmoricola sp.]|nr:single-stranded DNA-binding protein [Marmoricola sp.]
MNDTFVTFHGWAGSDVRHRMAKDVSVATVRVGVTPRLKRDGDWYDGETTWYSVTAWRTLADHVRDSVRKGDPLIVHGRLRSETWQPPEGPATVTLHVDALLVGHDLNRGITHFIRQRPERVLTGPEQSDGLEPGAEAGESELSEESEGATSMGDVAA